MDESEYYEAIVGTSLVALVLGAVLVGTLYAGANLVPATFTDGLLAGVLLMSGLAYWLVLAVENEPEEDDEDD